MSEPLHGLPDDSNDWNQAMAFQVEYDLKMTINITDNSLFFKRCRDELAGLYGKFVDYPFKNGSEEFLKSLNISLEKILSRE